MRIVVVLLVVSFSSCIDATTQPVQQRSVDESLPAEPSRTIRGNLRIIEDDWCEAPAPSPGLGVTPCPAYDPLPGTSVLVGGRAGEIDENGTSGSSILA